MLEEASARRAAAAAEESSPGRVKSPTLSTARLPVLQAPFEPGDRFFAAATALWADAAVREAFDKINPCAFDKVRKQSPTFRVISGQKNLFR